MSQAEKLLDEMLLASEQATPLNIGTHGPGCHTWGPSHYECLLREFQKREWVGLTEQEVFECIEANTEWKPAAGLWRLNEVDCARAIEAKLKEKNT